MKPKFSAQCINSECENFKKDEEVPEDPCDLGLYCCNVCRSELRLHIEHAGKTFSRTEAYGQHLIGLAKEMLMLQKLIDRGVATPEEEKERAEIADSLVDTKCTCCLNPILDGDGLPLIGQAKGKGN